MAQGTTLPAAGAYSVSTNRMIVALSIGVFVGIFGSLLSLGIRNWVLNPIFCRSSDTASICANSDLTAWIVGFVIISVVGLFMLIRANVFRPLLVVLAAIATLWAVGLWFSSQAWWIGMLWQGGLFAVAYALYTWLASLEKFAFSLIAVIIVAVLMRLIFVY